jgi:hypothetical protein
MPFLVDVSNAPTAVSEPQVTTQRAATIGRAFHYGKCHVRRGTLSQP